MAVTKTYMVRDRWLGGREDDTTFTDEKEAREFFLMASRFGLLLSSTLFTVHRYCDGFAVSATTYERNIEYAQG